MEPTHNTGLVMPWNAINGMQTTSTNDISGLMSAVDLPAGDANDDLELNDGAEQRNAGVSTDTLTVPRSILRLDVFGRLECGFCHACGSPFHSLEQCESPWRIADVGGTLYRYERRPTPWFFETVPSDRLLPYRVHKESRGAGRQDCAGIPATEWPLVRDAVFVLLGVEYLKAPENRELLIACPSLTWTSADPRIALRVLRDLVTLRAMLHHRRRMGDVGGTGS